MPYDSTAPPLAVSATPPPPLPTATPIAHWTHTAALFLALAITTVAGHLHADSPTYFDTPRIPRYITSIVAEWLLLGAVIAGIYVRRTFFHTTLLQRIPSLGLVLGLGPAVYISSAIALALVRALLQFTPLAHKVNLDVILAMAPHTPLEFLLWFGVSLSAGICEELIFRGYLLQQFTAWLRSPIAAIFATGILFGFVHLYEGLGAILPLATLGIVYGFVVRYFKGDVRAVIFAHFLQDFLVAFLVLAAKHVPHASLKAVLPF